MLLLLQLLMGIPSTVNSMRFHNTLLKVRIGPRSMSKPLAQENRNSNSNNKQFVQLIVMHAPAPYTVIYKGGMPAKSHIVSFFELWYIANLVSHKASCGSRLRNNSIAQPTATIVALRKKTNHISTPIILWSMHYCCEIDPLLQQ